MTKTSPTSQFYSRGTSRFPAPLHLSPFSPPDRDKSQLKFSTKKGTKANPQEVPGWLGTAIPQEYQSSWVCCCGQLRHLASDSPGTTSMEYTRFTGLLNRHEPGTTCVRGKPGPGHRPLWGE